MALKIIDRYLCIVREHCVQFLLAPLWSGQRAKYTGNSITSALVRFDQPAIEAVIIPSMVAETASERTVTVLLRCSDEGFDILRQFKFILGLDDEGVKSADQETKDAENHKFPCDLSTWSYTVGVAPSSRQFIAGPSGKGLWIETRNVTSRHSVHPARCLVGFQVGRPEDIPKVQKKGVDSDTKSCTMLGNDVQIPETVLYARRCDISEILHRKYCMTKVALEDTIGRVAIGDRRGRVEILDFA